METPFAFKSLIILNNCSFSESERDAVGSSRTNILAFLDIAFAISTIWLIPTLS
ncbi:hypothetical protein D3C76_1463960 [compost metagenome]